ncbi:hypothetical protein BH10BDE1_BH10BDE1_09690 [soil metagenome]
MNTVENGIRSYRNTEVIRKSQNAVHPLDIAADIAFDVKSEMRGRDSQRGHSRTNDIKESREEFRDILKRELGK